MILRLGRRGPGFEPRNSPFTYIQLVVEGQRSRKSFLFERAHGVVVSRLLRMQKALGSNPSGSISFFVGRGVALKCRKMRTPGIEPGAQAWEACMLPLHYERLRIDD